MNHRTKATAGVMAACLFLGTGCGQEALIQSDLPIKRVVVYRNGVAYFERAGHVADDRVSFKMKQEEVGDFLATLAVMEQGGSSVRSAAFPLDLPDDADADDDAGKAASKKLARDHALKTVVLALDGRAHDLQVGYVAASPVWRPSYRLVMEADGQVDLQAWGIVQNLSGEDWTGVKLALVAGAPVAFDARLGTPVTPDRPVVTDQGEVIAAVPKAETSVAQDNDSDGIPDDAPKDALKKSAPGGAAPPPPPPVAAQGKADADRGEGGTGVRAKGEEGAMGNPNTGDTRAGWVQPSPAKNLKSLAAIAAQGGSTRYDIPTTVTVPDKSATMVLLLEQRVRGESIYLFAPDDGVPDSAGHPFHVARFVNATTGTLERGPIAVFQQGSFLGQGMVDPLAAGATATVPFALERAIGVNRRSTYDVQGSRVSKIENGALFIERDVVQKTYYDVENGGDQAAKLLVKHPRASEARLFQPPAGTEDNVGAGSALVPGVVPAHGKFTILVDERTARQEYTDWFSEAAATAVKAYIADPRSNKDVAQKLSAAWPQRGQIVAKQEQRNKLQQELNQLNQESWEKRADLRAIEKNKAAEALRKRLTDRLAAVAARQDTLNAQIIQLGQDISELQIGWRDAIRAITLTEVPPPKL